MPDREFLQALVHNQAEMCGIKMKAAIKEMILKETNEEIRDRLVKLLMEIEKTN